MVAPNVDIRVFDLSVYVPRVSGAIVGAIGPATKGPVNTLTEFTDEGNFVDYHGRPADGHYGSRALIRYFGRGNAGKYVRVAGPNIKTASLTLYAADGKTPILILKAGMAGAIENPGTWANGKLAASITHNGTQSYNLAIYFEGQLKEQFVGVDNGTVVTRINTGSRTIVAALASGAAATFPAETVNTITGAVDKKLFSGGDDGAFATTNSASSSTGGVAGRRFYGKMDTSAGSRVFANILTITPALAGKTSIYGTVGMPVTPGTFTIRVQTAGGPTFIELADNGTGGYTPGAAGMGLLLPASSTHKGFIDYRTGAWGVKLAAGTTFAGGTVDGIWTRATAESVGATAKGTGTYAGNLSGAACGVGFYNANKALITVPIDELVGTPNAGATAASSQAALKTLAGWIVPGTVVLTPAHATLSVPAPVYDDGFGGWRTGPRGTGLALTGTLDYRTGAFSVTWDPTGSPTTMPASGTLGGKYDIAVFDMGGGAVPGSSGTYKTDTVQTNYTGGGVIAVNTDTNASFIGGPILPGNVKLVISDVGGTPYTAYDDGIGGWLTRPRGDPRGVAVTGSITYATGAWTITPGGTIAAAATVLVSYTSVAGKGQARRSLRGTGPQYVADTTPNAAGLDLAAPAAGNAFDGPNFLDHVTGAWGIKLNLVPTGANTFDVKDNGTLTAVYVPADILGFGDGSKVVFTGTLGPAPFRRQANRLVGFQGAEASAAGAGDAQVTFATLGTTQADDYWSENSALSTDVDNFVDYRDGTASIKWTSAPLLDESTFVVAEETVLHVTADYPGDIGNERKPTITSGLYVEVKADVTLPGTLKLEVYFNSVLQESFGQAANIDELVSKVNDSVNGSKLVTVASTVDSSALPVDTTATQRCGMSGAFTIADIIGTKVGQTYTGMQLYSNDETVPLHWLIAPGQWHRQVITAMQTLCEAPGRRAIGVIPMPDLDDPLKFRDFVNGSYNAAAPGGVAVATVTVPYPPLVAIDSTQLATITPWVNYFDSYNNVNVWEPSDGDMLDRVAATPNPWQAIAGMRRGKIRADKIRYSPSRGDRNLIYGVVGNTTEVINTIIRKEGRGLVLGGQRTAARNPTALDRINVRWTVNVLMNMLDLMSQEFLFELNDSILWREATATLNKLLQPVVEARGLQEAFVLCDGTTTTADNIDRLEMGAKLYIKPARAVEYIIYDLILTPTGANFADIQVRG
jgi:hypothetical protein